MISFPILQLNNKKVIVSANQLALQYLFYPNETIIGEPLIKFVREIHTDILSLPFDQFLGTISKKPTIEAFINKNNLKINMLFQPIKSLYHITDLNCLLDLNQIDTDDNYYKILRSQTESEDLADAKTHFIKLDELQDCIVHMGPNPKENIKKLINCSKEVTHCDLILYQKINNNNIRMVYNNNQDASTKSMRASLNNQSRLSFPDDFAEDLYCENGCEGEYKSFAKIPISMNSKIGGVLNLYYEHPQKFSLLDKKILSFLGKIISIEEEKYIQQEEIKKILTIISHEIRQPLSIVKGYAELFPKYHGNIDSAISKQIIQGIKVGANRLNHLLNEFIMISGIFNQDASLTFQEFSIKEIISSAIATIDVKEDRKRIQINGETKSHAKIVTNKDNLVNILAILIDNALKFSESEKIVIVKIQELYQYMQIQIIDHGIGIKTEDLSNLFQRIKIPEEINLYSGQGMGLGLYIAFELIQKIQGKIDYLPNPEGGSIFSVKLPIY